MDVRTRMLDAAEKLLDASPDRDISTRAVCEAVGVGAPTLYRLFGDKTGLMRAVVDHGFDRYLAGKRAAPISDDPVQDLRNGWDSHVAFALAHPSVYRLMYSPSFAEVPDTAKEALRLLREVLIRCAAVGRLRADLDLATQTIMAANIGVALSMITQPDMYTSEELSRRVRDAVHASVLTDLSAPADRREPIAASASQLLAAADVEQGESTTVALAPLTEPETALLRQWLETLSGTEKQPRRAD